MARDQASLDHSKIEQRFEEFLRQQNLKMTPQRRRIFDKAFEVHEHFSVERMYEWLKAEEGPAVSRAPVYRTLEVLERGGFIAAVATGRGEVVYEHVKNVVTRYRRTVSRWTIVSGLHVNSHFTFNYDQLMDLTRLCVLLVRRLQPKARVFLGLDQPWGEYFAKHRQSLPPMLYADTVAQSGVVVDGYAIRLVLGGEDTGHASRDLMAISALLDRAALLEKPIALSTIAAPAVQPESASAGSWRGGWDPEHQARWLEQVVAIAAAKPYAHSICWADLVDQTMPGCPRPSMGLVKAEGQPRPALGALTKIRAEMKAGRSPLGALHTNGAAVAN